MNKLPNAPEINSIRRRYCSGLPPIVISTDSAFLNKYKSSNDYTRRIMNNSIISNRRKNPRFKKRFKLKIRFRNRIFDGETVEVSAFGANVLIDQKMYDFLISQQWQKSTKVFVSTSLNDLRGEINNVFIKDGCFYLGLKLSEERSWYS